MDRRITRYLENPDADVMEKPDEEIFKIWPTQLNRNIFSSIVRAGSRVAVENEYPLIKLPRKRKPEIRSELVEGYLYFYDEVQNWLTTRFC